MPVDDDRDVVADDVHGTAGRVGAQVTQTSRAPARETVKRPWTNTPSSGATRGSPRSFTVAKATCFVPCRYVTT